MPTITVEGPVLANLDKKRELVRGMTDVAARVYGIPAQAMVVLIRENPPENVGIGGELLADRRKA
jgi:4-oxalocrotonate tautomerase